LLRNDDVSDVCNSNRLLAGGDQLLGDGRISGTVDCEINPFFQEEALI
jgi:hypothetical protein